MAVVSALPLLRSSAILSIHLALLVACAAPAARAADLQLATGAEGGAYAAIGRALEAAIDGHPRIGAFKAVASHGSVENARRLASGEAALAIVQGDVLHDAYNGRGEFSAPNEGLRALAVLFPEALHVVARPEANARTLAQLKGKRVSVGAAGSGGSGIAWLAFQTHGIGLADLRVKELGPADAIEAFRRGEIDAIVAVGAVPHRLAAQAIEAGGRLVPIEPAVVERAIDTNVFLRLGKIAKGAYGTDADVPTLETDALLACGPSVTERLGADLCALTFASAPRLLAAHPAAAALDPSRTAERAPIPIHPGAVRWLEEARAIQYPVQVYTGLYAYSISELDVRAGTFLFDGYIWFRWKGFLPGEGNRPFEFEIVNGTIETIDPPDRPIEVGGWHRQSRHLSARLRGNFLLHDYPFDTQHLRLEMEHRWLGSEKLVFVPDDAAAKGAALRAAFLASDLKIDDWAIRDVRHAAVEKKYETDFGSIEKGVWTGTSSRYILTVTIGREVLPYVVKLLLPLVIIVAMGFLAFWVRPEHFDTRVLLGIVSLLSCVGLHAIESDPIPAVGYLVRADIFFILSYAAISLALLEVVAERNLAASGREAAAERLRRVARRLVPVAFAVAVAATFVA